MTRQAVRKVTEASRSPGIPSNPRDVSSVVPSSLPEFGAVALDAPIVVARRRHVLAVVRTIDRTRSEHRGLRERLARRALAIKRVVRSLSGRLGATLWVRGVATRCDGGKARTLRHVRSERADAFGLWSARRLRAAERLWHELPAPAARASPPHEHGCDEERPPAPIPEAAVVGRWRLWTTWRRVGHGVQVYRAGWQERARERQQPGPVTGPGHRRSRSGWTPRASQADFQSADCDFNAQAATRPMLRNRTTRNT